MGPPFSIVIARRRDRAGAEARVSECPVNRAARSSVVAVFSRARCTRSCSAPVTPERCPSAPSSTNAASLVRASRTRRTATARGSAVAPSSTTRPNAPLRSSTSAHHAPRAGSLGRTTHNPSCVPSVAQSRGASVRAASTYATHHPAPSAAATSCRVNVVTPLPGAPVISVSRPRGRPPPGSAASSAATPVASPGVVGRVPSTMSASCWRRAAMDTGNTTEDGLCNYRINTESARVDHHTSRSFRLSPQDEPKPPAHSAT